MDITEKDIYTFVFFPDSLDEQKAAFIRNNRKAYTDVIDSYTELKKSLGADLSADLQVLIAENITDYKPMLVIKLLEQKKNEKHLDSAFRVAAEFEDDHPDSIVKTFAPGGESVIIAKVVRNDAGQKLYLLTDQNDHNASYLVRLLPEGKEIFFEKNNRCTEFSSNIEVEEIEIEFVMNK